MAFSGDNDVVDVVLYDVNGNLLTVSGSQGVDPTQPMIPVAGLSGSFAHALKITNDGTLFITGSLQTTLPGLMNVTGSVYADLRPALTGSSTPFVAASITTVTLFPANPARRGATVYNNTNKYMYLRMGVSASTSNFSVKMPRDAYFEAPFNYTGVITAVWEAGVSGNAQLSEIV